MTKRSSSSAGASRQGLFAWATRFAARCTATSSSFTSCSDTSRRSGDGASRLLGIDDQGREILTYIEGEVFVGPEEVGDRVRILTDPQLASAGRLIRRFHDATAGTSFAGVAEVVCHPDLVQHNIVFQGEEAVAIIDWDEDVAPGSRIFDLSHAVWCLAEIGEQGGPVADQAHRARIVCDAYGWDDRSALIDEIEARFRRALAHAQGNELDAGGQVLRSRSACSSRRRRRLTVL